MVRCDSDPFFPPWWWKSRVRVVGEGGALTYPPAQLALPANGVSSWATGRPSGMTWTTSQPRTRSASETSRRWQRHHGPSEHMTVVRRSRARDSSSARPAANSAEAMWSA